MTTKFTKIYELDFVSGGCCDFEAWVGFSHTPETHRDLE